MTRKIYYENSYQTEFDAVIVRQEKVAEGWRIELDRTCFYPGGGGQPADTGWLQGVPVRKVFQESGTIFHLTERQIQTATVRGRVNRELRRDAMQQHTGQHLISACLLKVGNYPTVSVHFGENTTAIEIDSEEIAVEKLLEAEQLANALIEKNLDVKVHWATPDELGKFSLRRRPPEKENIRIIEIEDFDYSACSGTHLSTTREVRLVKWVHQEKIRHRRRLHFKIGDRALADYQERVEVTRQLSGMLSCGLSELPASVSKLQDTLRKQSREITALRKEHIAVKAGELLARARTLRDGKFIAGLWQDEPPEIVSGIVTQLLGGSPCLVWIVNRQSKQTLWTLASSWETPFSLDDFIRPYLEKFSAKGGGRGAVLRGKLERAETGKEFFEKVEAGLLKELKNA